jgi:hopanoid biosynthesis associated protein HpnK
MKQLIVNADDFGLTNQVNQGILEAHRHGIVTSTTLMANGEAFESAVEIARHVPDLGVGIHLNLTQGIPVSPAHTIRTLVNKRGRLYLSPGRLWRGVITRQVTLDDIHSELRAQIAKVRRAGISPTHLDGHKHVHVLPGISKVVIRLAGDFGIRSVRCPVEEIPRLSTLLQSQPGVPASLIKQSLVARGVSYFARRFGAKLTRAGIFSPAHFYGICQTGFLNIRGIQDVLQHLPEGASELMCHPGYFDTDLERTGTRLLAQREVEIQALTADPVGKLVMTRNIQLSNYRDVGSTQWIGAAA